MRVLFVAPYIPSPVRVRPYQWIRALARHGLRVRLVALQPPEDRWLTEPPIADCCERVTVFPLSRVQTLCNAAAAWPGDLPLQAAYSLHPAAERYIAAEALNCDIVHVEHLRGALLARRVQDVPCVIDAVDSISTLFAQAARQHHRGVNACSPAPILQGPGDSKPVFLRYSSGPSSRRTGTRTHSGNSPATSRRVEWSRCRTA